MPEPLSLARRPTPVHRLERLSARLGADVWVKRDDLTGLGLSGNKVRKLERLLADARAQGADTIVTCGGVQSNHCRATAVAARQLGMQPVLLLRGEPTDPPDGNLLLDTLLGATLHFCDADTYRHRRDERMQDIAGALAAHGRRPYVVPEGGSNGLGALAFVDAADELAEQVSDPFDVIVLPVGSGGTLAGLALGRPPGRVRGVAVCDDAPTFEARVRDIAQEAGRLGAEPLEAPGDRWAVVEGYQGPAYGVAEPSVWRTMAQVARDDGLLLDPVYTGKAMAALVGEVEAGRWGGRVLFWHTGGLFGLFGRGGELTRALGAR